MKSLPLVRVILRELQRSDLNLLAAYRKIPVLTGRVSRVVYTRALTRAVYRKTRAEIAALLEASGRVTVPDDRAATREAARPRDPPRAGEAALHQHPRQRLVRRPRQP